MRGDQILPVYGEVAAASAADGGGGPPGDARGDSPLHQPAAGPPPRERGGFSDNAADLAGIAGVAFGWSPDAFWRATPAELAALVRAVGGQTHAPAPVDLAGLMERFPDE